MIISIAELVQVGTSFAFVAGAAYWGGKVQKAVEGLCRAREDHEQRIRVLEYKHSPAPVRVD